MLVVNVGHRDYGYSKVEPLWKKQLDHYISNVAIKYEDEFIKENIDLAKDVISGKKINWSKYTKIAKLAAILGVVVTAFEDITSVPAYASTIAPAEVVDLEPLKRLTDSIWWTMFKAFGYIATPLLGWAGFTLAFSGSNSSKRTTAKVMIAALVGGLLFLGGAPWVGDQLSKIVSHVFGKYM